MPLVRADVRDVCFLHWPVDPDELADRLPDALAPATREGTGWVSVLAQRTRAGIQGIPIRYEFPQVTVRTYVHPETASGSEPDIVGVYFVRIAAASRFATIGARRFYGVPYHRTSVTHRPNPEGFEIGCVGSGGETVFAATVQSTDEPTTVSPDSLVGWLTERYRYYLADGRDGEIRHEPWKVAPADAVVHEQRLLTDVGLPESVGDPVVRYSPRTDIWLTRRP